MLNGGKAVRDRDGKIVEAAAFQKGEKEAEPGRVKPDRRWFGKQPALIIGVVVVHQRDCLTTGHRQHESHLAVCA